MKYATLALAAVAAAATVSISTAAEADAALYYGAIAYSPNGSAGTAYNYPSRGEAEAVAEAICGYSNCKTLTSFTGCGAVAESATQYVGGSGPTLFTAQQSALLRLASRSGPGVIDAWACNRGSG